MEKTSWRTRSVTVLATAAILAGFGQTPVLAQSAGQITPPSFTPETAPRLQGTIDFTGGAGLQAPEGADRLSLTLSGTDIEGAFPQMSAAHAAFDARLTGGTILASEIFEAAQELQRAYAQAGFVLARVNVPPQSLRDGGTLRIQIIDGFIETIDAEALPERVEARIQSLVAPLIGQRQLTLRDIERRLLLAGDTYGVALGSALATGATPGGTIIVLEPQYRGITGFVGFDNRQSNSLGEISIDTGLEVNGTLGMGEAFYGRLSGYPGGDFADGRGSSSAISRACALGPLAPSFQSAVTV